MTDEEILKFAQEDPKGCLALTSALKRAIKLRAMINAISPQNFDLNKAISDLALSTTEDPQ